MLHCPSVRSSVTSDVHFYTECNLKKKLGMKYDIEFENAQLLYTGFKFDMHCFTHILFIGTIL